MTRWVLCALSLLLLAAPSWAAPDDAARKMKSEISFAEHYLKEFENEVERAKGGQKTIFRSKNEALRRIDALNQAYPDEPQVKAMVERTRVALKKSYGNAMEITPDMLAYKNNEDKLRRHFAEQSAAVWQQLVASRQPKTDVFPAPDAEKTAPAELEGTNVLLEGVRWPNAQFVGATGEYIAVGQPSTGYYFVRLNGRQWLGPYEAIKRFRRQVDSQLGEQLELTVLGKITGVVMESTDPAPQKRTPYVFGWIVEPEALYLPGHVLARLSPDQRSGVFVDEDQLARLKEAQYTVKSVPPNATPTQLLEVYVTAIKEKNFALFKECIRPDWLGKDNLGQINLAWDMHQRRFQDQYVAVTFEEPKITVLQGFDTGNTLETRFLTEEDQKQLSKLTGGSEEMLEEAVVFSRAFDKNGRQLQRNPQRLLRKGGARGRWYVDAYLRRF